MYGRVAATGRSERREIYLTSLRMWFWISVYRPKPEHFVAVFDVITERKEQEQQILELNRSLEARVKHRTEDLERANRELEAFSYSISHDLRAPLRAINGFSKLLLESEGDKLAADSMHMLERVAHNASRMGELIDDILDYSRSARADMKKTNVDTAALASAIVAELRDSYPATTFNCGALPVVHGDATMLRQVLFNLIDNAGKFSSGKSDARVDIDCTAAGGEYVFSVRDNGAGFDMRYADKLFGMFQRMHNESRFPGTGVGLAIVKRLIERHGGRVWAESEPDKGAAFFFALPAAA
jgi:light-regulated signal transduction histidine kinase (bacteriophytochrome)